MQLLNRFRMKAIATQSALARAEDPVRFLGYLHQFRLNRRAPYKRPKYFFCSAKFYLIALIFVFCRIDYLYSYSSFYYVKMETHCSKAQKSLFQNRFSDTDNLFCHNLSRNSQGFSPFVAFFKIDDSNGEYYFASEAKDTIIYWGKGEPHINIGRGPFRNYDGDSVRLFTGSVAIDVVVLETSKSLRFEGIR
jgi:hypothetical protein